MGRPTSRQARSGRHDMSRFYGKTPIAEELIMTVAAGIRDKSGK